MQKALTYLRFTCEVEDTEWAGSTKYGVDCLVGILESDEADWLRINDDDANSLGRGLRNLEDDDVDTLQTDGADTNELGKGFGSLEGE